jgi:peptide/nickel transport system substrate-binding protein
MSAAVMRMTALLLCCASLLAAVSAQDLGSAALLSKCCQSHGKEPPPHLKVGQAFLAASNDPAMGNHGWALVSHGVGEKLFTVDKDDKLVPQLAMSAVRSSTDPNLWTITLEPGRYFSDGAPVTAADVAASLGRTNKENSNARSSCGVMTFAATEVLTLTIATSIPTPVMQSVLAEWAFVVYKTLPAGCDKVGTYCSARVFTGPYAIEKLDKDELVATTNVYYPKYSPCSRAPLVIKKYASGGDVTAALKKGEVHMGFNLPATSAAELNWVKDVTAKSYAVGYQYMMFFNTAKSHLSDVNVRKALALVVDRKALSQATHPVGMAASVIDQAVATGPFPAFSPWGAPSVHPRLTTNTAQAAQLLDAAGWTLTNGKRSKNGADLTVDLVYYTFRSDLVTMAPLIKKQFEAVGVTVTTRVNDDGNFFEGTLCTRDDKSSCSQAGFDLLLWAQHTLPAGDPNWFLQTFFKSTSGPDVSGTWKAQNFAQHNSANIDKALDTLKSAEGAARTEAAKTVHTIIINEVPATFLTSPTWHIGVHGRMGSYEPWGSDYYVIKSNMPDEAAGTCPPSNQDPWRVATIVLAVVLPILLLITVVAFLVMRRKKDAMPEDPPNKSGANSNAMPYKPQTVAQPYIVPQSMGYPAMAGGLGQPAAAPYPAVTPAMMPGYGQA